MSDPSFDLAAALMAARFAQEIGLPPGNLWEPALARRIAARLEQERDIEAIELEYRCTLGLPLPEKSP